VQVLIKQNVMLDMQMTHFGWKFYNFLRIWAQYWFDWSHLSLALRV